MTYLSHRNKIMITAILLMLFAQIIFVWIGYSNAQEVAFEIEQTMKKDLFKHAHNNAISLLKDVTSLETLLESSDFTNYARYYLNLREEPEVAKSSDELNHRMNTLRIPSQIVNKIFILGENINQKNFVKSIGSESWPEEDSPWIEDLRYTGLLEPFLKVYGLPVYFEKGELLGRLDHFSKKITPDRRERIVRFLQQLEGHLIINNGINASNVMTFIVLDPNLFHNILSSGQWREGNFAILDQEDRVIWTNISNHQVLDKVIGTKPNLTESEWRFNIAGTTFDAQSSSLSPYGFRMVYANPVLGTSITENGLLIKNTILSFGGLVVTFIVAYFFSNSIFQPFRTLSHMIHDQSYSFSLRILPENLFFRKRFSSISIRNKILLLLLIAVIIPVISASIFYTWFLYNFAIDQVKKSLFMTSQQMSLDVRYQMGNYENLINQLSVDGKLQTYQLKPVGIMDSVPNWDVFVSLYPELSDVSYFVLYNSSGVARYSSIFLNNMGVFSLNLGNIPPDNNDQQLVWIANTKDVFNRSTVTLVKKSLYPFFSDDAKTQRVGYLQLVLKENAFQTIDLDHRSDFVILDNQGNLIYTSIPHEQYDEIASVLAASVKRHDESPADVRIKNVDGRDQAIAIQSIPQTNWNMFVFHPLDAVLVKTNKLINRDLLVIVIVSFIAVIAAWMLSRFLVRPIERLRTMMADMGNGNLEQRFEYEARDEIGKLVRSFNHMVIQINHLMEQNVKNQVREQELISLKTRAELGMLQQQINPHFLYNTLEAINMRSRRYGAVEVSTMVNSLAKIFRFSINTGDEMVLLETEIEHTRNYITIQEIRFPDKFAVRWDLDNTALSNHVLKFILQPIVENAINHGINDYTSGGELRIAAKVEEEMLILEVHDNGIGMERSKLDKLISSLQSGPESDSTEGDSRSINRGKGVGLRNVYNRLKIYYHDQARMIIRSEDMQGTIVIITIPIDMKL